MTVNARRNDEEESEFVNAPSHLFTTITSQIQDGTMSKPLARDYVDGLIIDTAATSDMGAETAIMDEVGVHPVARYSTKEMAMTGHVYWCKWAEDGHKTVVKLGYPGLTDDEEIRIVRMR